jgi:hypothetical protein
MQKPREEKIEMQRMMELLLKEIRTNQAKMDANQERMEANRKKNQEDFMAKLDAYRRTDKEDFMARMDANMKAWREKTDADMEAWQKEICSMRFETTNTRNETLACQEMEAHQEEEEPSSVDMKPEVVEQRKVPVEDAEVMQVGEPKKKRRRDRKLAAVRRRQKNEKAQCQDGYPTRGLG